MTIITASARPVGDISLRLEVEDFLYYEAAMIDDWRLEEWVELFTLDCIYEIPPIDRPNADAGITWSLIHDKRTMLEQRIIRLKKPEAHAEFPHSRTRHLVSNVRVVGDDGQTLQAVANFIVTRTKSGKFDLYAGHYQYELVREDAWFKIRSKRAILDHDRLNPQGKISFIL